MFEGLRRNNYAAILADPPWRFKTWDKREAIPKTRSIGCTDVSEVELHYNTMSIDDICALPVETLAADDCSLFLWMSWPQLEDALRVITAWGFTYKTAAFVWTKVRSDQLEMFKNIEGTMGMGFWTRANTEACLLATRGRPKRINADVRQSIIEPRREHSRKPDCVHDRIERLVAGPYLELFARRRRDGWTCVGDEVDKFREAV